MRCWFGHDYRPRVETFEYYRGNGSKYRKKLLVQPAPRPDSVELIPTTGNLREIKGTWIRTCCRCKKTTTWTQTWGWRI
jgi:hypothetical protein